MRSFLVVLLCITSLSASAQWWRVGPLKNKRYPLISEAKDRDVKKISLAKTVRPKLNSHILKSSSDYNRAEFTTMRTAQRNMRYRVYNAASYNFSDLAKIYIQQNRLSEAKWYLLQSTFISRRENDDRHTYANLVSLAAVKIDIGEVNLARQDLMEARDIANSKGWIRESKDVDTRLKAIQGVNTLAPKGELRYAEAVELDNKSK
ncbi:MAG: hypothetical protein EOP47_24225 [Sphingobacteriaceae bacterium]|nr:MAG: hypothetical protein EOP47_24225 [Sphingobacteriaceae bacterium]